MSFPLCSPKVTPCLHFPWGCSQAELSGHVSSESYMGYRRLLRRNKLASNLKELLPFTLFKILQSRDFSLTEATFPLKNLLVLAASSHLNKHPIPHEENKVKNPSTTLPSTTIEKYLPIREELFMTVMGKVKKQIHWIIRQWIFWRMG